MRHPCPPPIDIARSLAVELRGYARRADVVVLARTPEVAPLAAEVARSLQAPHDLFLVWPLVTPAPECLQIGAVASGGVLVLDAAMVKAHAVPTATLARGAQARARELGQCEHQFRDARAPVDLRHRKVIVVDDGRTDLATWCLTIAALRRHWIASVVVASASMPTATCRALLREVAEVVAALGDEPPQAGPAELNRDARAPAGVPA